MEVLKYIEGSFIPARDGASERFSQVSKNLPRVGAGLTVIHCRRGWSDLDEIAGQDFQTYAVSPKYFYQDHAIAERAISEQKPDIIEMDGMEQILSGGIYLSSKFGIPLVFDVHFVSSVLMGDLGADLRVIEGKRLQEKKLNEVISGAICFTDLDRNNFINSTGVAPERVCVIPIGSDTETIRMRKLQAKDRNIVFLGNMYFEPNSEAVQYTVEHILPAVIEKNPDVKFKFVGDVSDSLKSRYESEHAIFTGRVDDINQVFEQARVCIAPIQTGGGMRVKVLTYMATGVPIVTTSIGSEGVSDLSTLRIGDTSQVFVELINNLLQDFEGSLSLGRCARELVEQEYSWKTIAKKCLDFYKTVIANPLLPKIQPSTILEEPFWLTETIEKGRFKRQTFDQEEIYHLGSGNFIKIEL